MLIKYKNLPLLSKICIIISTLTLATSSIIMLTFIGYYSRTSSERLLRNAQTVTSNAVNTLEVNFKDILEHFVRTCGTEEFAADIKTMNQPSSSYVVVERLVQNELSDLAKCNYMVHSSMMIKGDGSAAYTMYKNPMRRTLEDFIALDELAAVKGITCLPQRSSPFRSSVPVIPILFPVTVSAADYAEVKLDGTVPDLYIVILLDCSKLKGSLDPANVKQSRSVFYLLAQDGTPLNIGTGWEIPQVYDRGSTKGLITSLVSGNQKFLVSIQSDSYLILGKLNQLGLVLLNYVERESIQTIFGNTGMMLIFVLLVVVCILLLLSILMTRYVTRPAKRLTEIIRQIERDEYKERQDFATSDEMGQLCTAINTMYDTIQQQMVRIKQEESEKRMTEIKMLTEQINPHFLYNTLECIQSEVIRGESQTAASMIQYLAEYLRIGLSYGADLITASNELRHANAYIKLMNQRFRQSIIFMYQLSPRLNEKLILKTILQPLVENSIKHGFGIDAPGIPISVPTIEVNFSEEGERLVIEVADNGCGFDVKAAEDIMYATDPEEARRHVGLHNIYHRLISYYGKENVDVVLNSIPYYRSTITIKIPLMDQKKIS